MSLRQRILRTLELMRCPQWIKNVFVFAAPLFGRELGDSTQMWLSAVTFACFCLISSAVYVLNDLVDIEHDRAHPEKRLRVLASGRLSTGYAKGLMIFLAAVAGAVCFVAISPGTAGILGLYLVSNVLYSFVVKKIVILDVGFIALGFIFRILAGAIATSTEPSHWLLLCTFTVALFLGFAKRRAELINLGDGAEGFRSVLADYSEGFLDQMIAIVTTTTLICYILYTVDERTASIFGHRGLVVTVPFVMYGIFRYLYLTYHQRAGGSPTKTILMDPLFMLNNLCWGVACIAVIYWGDRFADWIP